MVTVEDTHMSTPVHNKGSNAILLAGVLMAIGATAAVHLINAAGKGCEACGGVSVYRAGH